MTNRLRLELPLLLPQIDDVADSCVARLVGHLRAREGVRSAHVVAAAGNKPAQLCVHYDPDLLPLPRIREIARNAGAEITERFGHVRWNVEELSNERRARTVAERMRRAPGIVEADASSAGVVRMEFDCAATSEGKLRQLLGEMGVHVVADGAGAPPDTSVAPAADKGHAGHGHESGKDHSGHDHGPDETAGDHDHGHGGNRGPRMAAHRLVRRRLRLRRVLHRPRSDRLAPK